MPMEWKKLLCPGRLGSSGDAGDGVIDPARSPFQRDFDRVVFSSAFRRLQDKTQVFPLAENDYVRTRLTHSMETATIARSLGTNAGVTLCREFDTGGITPSDIGAIAAAASLAHDIGNPPLGHGGEEAIRYWFTESATGKRLASEISAHEADDVRYYEGNAHGFRVLSRLQMPDRRGGMRLCCATLGAFAKYPCSSDPALRSPGIAGKKFNYFQSEKDLFCEVAERCGMPEFGPGAFARHPLAFLVEAADDIAYRIVDFEDGHMAGIIPYETLEDIFCKLLPDGDEAKKYVSEKIENPVRKAEFLRATVIGALVRECSKVFVANQDSLLAGTFDRPLIECIPQAPVLKEIEDISREKIYRNHRVAEIISAGFELVSGMLEILVPAAVELADAENGGRSPNYRSGQLYRIMPQHMPLKSEEWRASRYVQLMYVLDYLSGMTDSFAVSMYKKLKGISL